MAMLRLASPASQRGAGLVGMLLLVLVGIIVVRTAINVIPMYWQDYRIGNALTQWQESGSVSVAERPQDIEAHVQRILSSNDLQAPLEGLRITRSNRQLTLDWPYEKRTSLVGNIDLVVRFHHNVEFSQ